MKVIRKLADVQSLKNDECLPSFYVEEIYHQFLGSYEAMTEGEAIEEFVLPLHACIYHFNHSDDRQMLEELVYQIEYVDTEVKEGCKYFRIGVMQQDHEILVIFFLEGTLPYKTEKWLEN